VARSSTLSSEYDIGTAPYRKGQVLHSVLAAAVNIATGNLENETAPVDGGATNVQVQITDGDGARIDLASTSQANNPYIDITNDAATLPYKAQYVSSNGQAIAGLVNTALVYTLEYQ
jgi:major type 1 subunit fimbrin (pilin)